MTKQANVSFRADKWNTVDREEMDGALRNLYEAAVEAEKARIETRRKLKEKMLARVNALTGETYAIEMMDMGLRADYGFALSFMVRSAPREKRTKGGSSKVKL